MYSYGPPHMAKQKQDDQLELTYSSYVRTQDVTLKTCQRRWIIARSGERGSGISVLAARHDDDDYDIKAKIDKMQQNSRWRLRGHRDETINHIISKFSKLGLKEYKTRHDWVHQVIHRELCKKFKFDLTNKWYMHNTESVPENEAQKIRWDFEIQIYDIIRLPDLMIVPPPQKQKQSKKRTCRIVDFTDLVEYWVKWKEN